MYVTHLNRNRAFYISIENGWTYDGRRRTGGWYHTHYQPFRFVLTFEVEVKQSLRLRMAAIFRALIKFCPEAGYYYVISFNSNVMLGRPGRLYGRLQME